MTVYLLHGGEAAALNLASRLGVPHGRRLPEENVRLIIRFGTFAADPVLAGANTDPLVMNRAVPVLRAQKSRLAAQLLTISGLKCGGRLALGQGGKKKERKTKGLEPGESLAGAKQEWKPEKWAYEYAVPVFNLETLAVWERKMKPSGASVEEGREIGYREVPVDGTFHAGRAAKEAVRAIYALGLDYGLVRLAATASGETLVIAVEPAPEYGGRMGERLLDLWTEAVRKLAIELELEQESGDLSQDVLLGADPEFVLMTQEGKVVPASRYMERVGNVGSDAVILRGHKVILPLCELR
uniref:putative amidoligase domain-containing protein n=1 Tax=Gorillibacterium massiliense TaxID=1280390 RepID=UPI000594F1A0